MKWNRGVLLSALALFVGLALNAGQVADLGRDGVGITVEAEPETVDVGRDFMVTITTVAPKGKVVRIPYLQDRFQGFRVAEDFDETPLMDDSGRTTSVTHWRLVPEPFAKRYRLAPFVPSVVDVETTEALTFPTHPVVFKSPVAREAVTGEMEISPKRDFPSLSWRLVGMVVGYLAVVVLVVMLIALIVRKIRMMIRIHRMSPIERAMYELEELLKKGLHTSGRQKDFYVELTLVVRRYIGRQHEVRAPNLTTEEFFDATRQSPSFPKSTLDKLIDFLRRADMVKFAGVEATSDMIERATESARSYLVSDNEIVTRKHAQMKQRSKK